MLLGGHQAIKKPSRPFLVVHVDLFYVSRRPINKEKSISPVAILLITCAYSKYIDMVILQKAKAQDVWDAFEDNFIYSKGAPMVVVSD